MKGGSFLSQLAVVGQYHQPFSVKIQTPDGEQSLFQRLQQVADAWAALGSLSVETTLRGLFKQEIGILLPPQDATVCHRP